MVGNAMAVEVSRVGPEPVARGKVLGIEGDKPLDLLGERQRFQPRGMERASMLYRRVGPEPTEPDRWHEGEHKHPKREPETLGWTAEMVPDIAEEEARTADYHHLVPVGIATAWCCANQDGSRDPAIIIPIGHRRREKPGIARNHQDRLERGARMDKPRRHDTEHENAEPSVPVVGAKAEQRRNTERSEHAGNNRCGAGKPDRPSNPKRSRQIDAQAYLPRAIALKVGREPTTVAVAKAIGGEIAGQHPMDRFIAKEGERNYRWVGTSSGEVQHTAREQQASLAVGHMAEPP